MAQPYIPPETKYTRAAVLLVGAQIRIAAPAHHVFKAHTDIKRYPEWNTFSPHASASADPLCKGASLTLKARMSASAPAVPTFLSITEISTPGDKNTAQNSSQNSAQNSENIERDPERRSRDSEGMKGEESVEGVKNADNAEVYRICWDTSYMPRMMLATHRVTEVTPDGEGACLFTTYETMSGGASYLVRMLLQSVLQHKFEGWCVELKGFAERTWDANERG